MALILTAGDDGLTGEPFDAIWQHYITSRFIYPAKLERLTPSLGTIRSLWPRLLHAPAELFQFHAAVHDQHIISSICAYRDTTETYVIQHAASSGQPTAMLQCIRACLSTINADPAFGFARMYYRPQNRWPSRASRAIADVITSAYCDFSTDDYLICDVAESTGLTSADQSVTISEAPASSDRTAVHRLAVAAIGRLRADALGLGVADLTMPALRQRFVRYGLDRSRRVFTAYRDGALAGVALCHISAVPMNFSYLCQRTEILVHPDAPSRSDIVTALARASIADAAARGQRFAVTLIGPTDVEAALRAGYTATQKQYACFLWSRENEDGAPSALAGIEHLYHTVARAATYAARMG